MRWDDLDPGAKVFWTVATIVSAVVLIGTFIYAIAE